MLNLNPNQITRELALASVMVLVLALAACQKNDGETVGQKVDAAIAKTEQAAKEAKADVQAAANDAKPGVKDAAQDVKDATKDAAAVVAEKTGDAAITASVNAELAKDPDLSAIKINVDTKDGKVTLSGPAPTSGAKDRATTLAKNVKGVTSVDNQLAVTKG
ncbi:MAG: BON domain-containing protein [Burkholderiaceae bacterium]